MTTNNPPLEQIKSKTSDSEYSPGRAFGTVRRRDGLEWGREPEPLLQRSITSSASLKRGAQTPEMAAAGAEASSAASLGKLSYRISLPAGRAVI